MHLSPERVCGWLGVLLFAVAIPAAQGQDAPAQVEAQAQPIDEVVAKKPGTEKPAKIFRKGVIIPFRGVIDSELKQFLLRKLAHAKKLNADLVVFEIESPGGYLSTTMELADEIRDTSWADTVAFVPHHAYSGAAVFSIACKHVFLKSDAIIGDAGPVFQDERFLFQHADEKVRSALVAQVRRIADATHRPAAIAESMVDFHTVVIWIKKKDTGEQKFITKSEWESNYKQEEWDVLEVVEETNKGTFFTSSGKRAAHLGLANGLVDDRRELQKEFGFQGEWVVLESSFTDHAISWLNAWYISALLVLLGLGGVIYEFCFPGTLLGALTATLCFGLFFASHYLGGTSGALEITLFLFGVVFLAAEVFILPGFGVSGVVGIALIFVSLVLASQDFIVPKTNAEFQTLSSNLGVMLGVLVVALFAGLWLLSNMSSIPFFRKMVLAQAHDKHVDVRSPENQTPTDFIPIDVGAWGKSLSPLRPAGKAKFGERMFDVVAPGMFLDADVVIKVVEIQGSRILVEPVEEKQL